MDATTRTPRTKPYNWRRDLSLAHADLLRLTPPARHRAPRDPRGVPLISGLATAATVAVMTLTVVACGPIPATPTDLDPPTSVTWPQAAPTPPAQP